MIREFLIYRALKKYQPRLIVVFGNYARLEARSALITTLAGSTSIVSTSASAFESDFSKRFGMFSLVSALFTTVKDFPETLVIDASPEDIAYQKIKSILAIDTAVVTPLGDIPSFTTVFSGSKKDTDALVEEIRDAKTLCLAMDDEAVRSLADVTQANVVTYGFDEHADVALSDYANNVLLQDKTVSGGVTARISYHGESAPLRVENALGKRVAYAACAAVAIAVKDGIALATAVEDVSRWEVPDTAPRVGEGIKGTALITHAYQVTPMSAREMIELMGALRSSRQARRTVLVMGGILDSDGEEEGLHRALGELAAQNINLLYLGGERVIFTEEAAQKAGMIPDNIHRFNELAEAARAAQDEIEPYDVILILGDEKAGMQEAIDELKAFDTVPEE